MNNISLSSIVILLSEIFCCLSMQNESLVDAHFVALACKMNRQWLFILFINQHRVTSPTECMHLMRLVVHDDKGGVYILMSKIITVVSNQLLGRHLARIREVAEPLGFEVYDYQSPAEIRQTENLIHLKETEILYSPHEDLIEEADHLKWCASPWAGADNFTKSGVLENKDIILTNSSGAYGVTIAEHVMMVTLELLRRQMEYVQIVHDHQWKRDLTIRSIKGSRITLIGTGDIGAETALRLRGFEPECIIGVNRSGVYHKERTGRGLENPFDQIVTKENLPEVLAKTDILVMSLPGTEHTRKYLGAEEISYLSPDAYVINVGRGTTIDQKALLQALSEGRIAGAALDVFEEEPIPQNDPAWDCRDLLITPHISGNMTLGYTGDYCVKLFCDNLVRYSKGEKLHQIVDIREGY